jgi:organic radical activating enzyme
MLSGERVAGCQYCWNAEDADIISDRILKSYQYDWRNYNSNIPISVNPKKIEIAFSRSCQLACAYCGPSFSSSWANDVNTNGSYGLVSNARFNRDIKSKLIPDDSNPYIQAFFDWWPEVKKELSVVRITGGEPLLHIKFWEFLNLLDTDRDYRGDFLVNSNLIHEKGQVEKLIEKTKFLVDNDCRVEVHTSCESGMAAAEYTRDGFKSEVWLRNVHLLLSTSNIDITITTAINNMSVWSFNEYLLMTNSLREQYGINRVQLNFNRVLFPQWHQISLIPFSFREEIAKTIEDTFNGCKYLQDDLSIMAFREFISYFRTAVFTDQYNSEKQVLTDMIKFYDQYNIRRNKDILTLDVRYVSWVESVRERLRHG